MSLLLLSVLVLLASSRANSDELLRQGERDDCIARVISTMPDSRNCHHMPETLKSQLALRMSQCLLSRMGRSLPSDCLADQTGECDITGDAWNTYTTFFSHIDNLCHFYWEVLHHERAEKLISGLAESSHRASETLRKNTEQTSQIIRIQQALNHSMGMALENQQEMSHLIDHSSQKIINLTDGLESFMENIKEDINRSFGSLRHVLMAIEKGVATLVSLHQLMSGSVTSLNGMLYFLSTFLIIGVFASMAGPLARIKCWTVLGINAGLEFVMGATIQWLIGLSVLRWLSVFLMIAIVLTAIYQSRETVQSTVKAQFSTPRLKRILHSAYEERNSHRCDHYHHRHGPCCSPVSSFNGRPIILEGK